MRFCGLDQALRNSGAAILDGDRFLLAEAFHQRGGSHAKAFCDFRIWWTGFLEKHKPDVVALEEPLRSDMQITRTKVVPNQFFGQSVQKVKESMSNFDTLLGLYGIRSQAIEICFELGVEYHEVNVRTWRSVIYGHASAPKGTKNSSQYWKQQAFDRCKQLGWSVSSSDAAESALIADWLRVSMSPAGRAGNDLFGSAA